jgi:hypothetical protein
VAAITKWERIGASATTEYNGFFFGIVVHQGSKFTAFMTFVAIGMPAALSTSTEQVHALFQLYCNGFFNQIHFLFHLILTFCSYSNKK